MKKLLITGASGFLGWNLCSVASRRYSIVAVCNHNYMDAAGVAVRRCDLTDYREVKDLFVSEKPDAVIHAAASANPNFCQTHPGESFKINVTASLDIAGLCADFQAACIFTSTDLVFNGKSPPYKEDDCADPVNEYGHQKAVAEQRMLSRYENVTICRMPLMYGDAPVSASSFIQPWIEQLLNGKELSLFTDEIRTPVSAQDASIGLLMALESGNGTIHLGGKQRLSRFAMGGIIAGLLDIPETLIKPCRQTDVLMAAPRPPDVSLDSSKAFSLGYSPGNMKGELVKLRCIRREFGI